MLFFELFFSCSLLNCVLVRYNFFNTEHDFLISIEFFNNSDAILNFEHIAMHCGLSRVI